MKCPECKWNYPQVFLSPLHYNGDTTDPICGICALALINEAHGINRDSFTGKMAEDNRQRAIQWRKDNPVKGPKVIIKTD